jgi:hypothetical protein
MLFIVQSLGPNEDVICAVRTWLHEQDKAYRHGTDHRSEWRLNGKI